MWKEVKSVFTEMELGSPGTKPSEDCGCYYDNSADCGSACHSHFTQACDNCCGSHQGTPT